MRLTTDLLGVRGLDIGFAAAALEDPARSASTRPEGFPLDRGTAAREICLGLRAESVPVRRNEERLKPGHDLGLARAECRGSGCPRRATTLASLPERVQHEDRGDSHG